MYNIEERINNWYKNQSKKPLVSEDDSDKNTENKTYAKRKIVNGVIVNPESRDELAHNVQEYINQLKNIYYGKPNKVEEKEFMTDEEIDSIATTESEKKHENSLLKENLKNESELRGLNNKKETATKKLASDVDKIENDYDNSVKTTKDSAIKNGISRSTILDGQIESASSQKQADLKVASDELDELLKLTNDEIADENARHEIALSDIENAKENTKKDVVDDLKAERKKIIDLENLLGDNISKVYKQENPSREVLDVYQKIIDECVAYYQTLDKETAAKEFENDTELQYMLGHLSDIIGTYVTGKLKVK